MPNPDRRNEDVEESGAVRFEIRGVPETLQFITRVRAIVANIERGRLSDPSIIADHLRQAIAEFEEPPEPFC